MNTGDSMYISPYVPHTFTTRKNAENRLGYILALTYADKIDGESINELSAIGYGLAKKFKLNINNEPESFFANLNYHLNAASMGYENIKDSFKHLNENLNVNNSFIVILIIISIIN